jgi:hypothetical protein
MMAHKQKELRRLEMTREVSYTPESWESVTRLVKESLEINSLTKSQSSTIMRLYVTGVRTDEIINQLKGEKK